MAKSIGALKILLLLDNKGFQRGIASTQKMVSNFAGTIMSSAISRVGAFGGALVAAAGVGGMGALIKSSADAVDRLNDMSQRLGVTGKALAALEIGAKMSGSSIKSVEKGLTIFSKALGNAQREGGKAGDTFRKLGLDARALASVPLDQAFGAVADRIKALPTPTERVAAAMEVFGKGGADMLQLIDGGSAGMAEYAAMASDLGLALSQADMSVIAEMNDQIDVLKMSIEGIGTQIAVRIAPIVTDLINRFVEWEKSGGGAAERVATAIGSTVHFVDRLINAFDGLVQVTQITVKWIGGTVVQALQLFANGVAGALNLLSDLQDTIFFTKTAQIKAPQFFDEKAWNQSIGNDIEQLKAADRLNVELARGGKSVAGNYVDQVTGGAQSRAAAAAAKPKSATFAGVDIEEMDAWANKAAKMVDDIKTPWDEYQEKIKEAQGALKRGLITQEQYRKIVGKAGDEYMKSVTKADKLKTGIDKVNEAAKGGAFGQGSALTTAFGTAQPGTGGGGGGGGSPMRMINGMAVGGRVLPHNGGNVSMVNGIAQYGGRNAMVPGMQQMKKADPQQRSVDILQQILAAIQQGNRAGGPVARYA